MKIPIHVDNRLRVRARLSEADRQALMREFTHRNPTRSKLEKSVKAMGRMKNRPKAYYALAAQLREEPVAISTWRLDQGELSLPRGGLARVRSVLEERGHELDVIDERCEGDVRLLPRGLRHDVELWDFQTPLVERVLEVEQGIVRSPVGSGKTTTLLRCVVEAGLPALIIVSTGNLFDQWIRRLQNECGLSRRDIGAIGQGEERLAPVTVGMQQALARDGRASRVSRAFGFVACDEVHLFAAKTFMEVIDHLPARFRVGVSDDERRKDRKEFLLYDLLGTPIAEVERDELVEKGFILDVEVRLVETGFTCGWWEELPEALRSEKWQELVQEMGADAERNALIASLAVEGARAGAQTLVFAHHVEHCARLRADVAAREPRVGLMVGEHKRELQQALAGFLDGSCRVGVGTFKAIGTGLDLPAVARGICATPIHTNKQNVQQVKGRICRSTRDGSKTEAVIYVLWDRACFGLAPVRNWVKWSKTTRVLVDGQWVEGKAFVKRVEARAAREEADDA